MRPCTEINKIKLIMKKILLSLGVIGIVAVVAISATGAFFSDTETSTGNTFTAGAIDLTVDSTQHYNGMVCEPNTGTDAAIGPYWWRHEGTTPAPAGTYPAEFSACSGSWLATDLGAKTFFNFPDVKPGDSGENTISLHVDSNDAYACVDVNITKNDDNGLTGPELAVDLATSTGGIGLGELAQNLNFFAWADTASTNGAVPGDNIWQAGELALFSNGVGPASDVLGGKTYTLADSNTGPLIGGATKYIGLAWCAGSMTAVSGVITCDGSTMGNNTQTDTMEASVAFRVEQARNNPNFRCVAEPKVFTLTDPSDSSELNRTSANGLPYFTYVINGLSIDLALVNPTGHTAYFDYRVDGELGHVSGSSGILISQGPLTGQLVGNVYNSTSVAAHSTGNITVSGTSQIMVGMHFGPEQYDYFDWATFTAN